MQIRVTWYLGEESHPFARLIRKIGERFGATPQMRKPMPEEGRDYYEGVLNLPDDQIGALKSYFDRMRRTGEM
jgi:hypothetical protein